MLGASGYLILRKPSGEQCEFDFKCTNCKRLSYCDQSKAKEFNKMVSSNNGGGQ